jgi:hypothetical protein
MMWSVSEAVSQWQRCPSCGGLLSEPIGSLGRDGPTCPDCGRMANASAHPFYGVYDSVEYDFDDVTPVERGEATDLLIGAGVPYRWDDGYRLLVSADREDEVDVLFAQLPDYESTDPAAETVEHRDQDNGDEEEPAEWVADEEAAEALRRLFDAADRLWHRPADEDAAAELADATGVVLIAPLPFGMNKVLWATAGTLARQLVDLVDGDADPNDVVAGADALRSVLRGHI